MPTYLYRREDGTTFEIEQRITAPALKSCPTTDQPVTRLISRGAGLVFKGSGFYLTDYARAGSKTDESQNEGSKNDKKTKASSESKSSSSSKEISSKNGAAKSSGGDSDKSSSSSGPKKAD